MKKLTFKKFDWWLFAILLLAAVLYGYGIWDAGSANAYYTAAITSMTQSWHNFWYGAFDPAGFITVDKPPVALWFMALSAKVFGIHSWSIVLPSVLAGIGSVALLYQLISPRFGYWAARAAAFVMTITPTVVANSRTNNMDAILVFFLLFAVWLLVKAVRKQKLWLLLLSFAVIGIAFNIKMLQAFMILPAMLVYYWLASKQPWRKKTAGLLAALAALGLFTVAYPAAVDAVNPSQRPYIGSSQKNSLLELAFGYNGTERLLGQSTGTGGTFSGMGGKQQSKQKQAGGPTGQQQTGQNTQNTNQSGQQNNQQTQTTGQTGQQQPQPPTTTGRQGQPGQAPGQSQGQKLGRRPSGQHGRPGGKGGANSPFAIGSAGPFRLFQSDLGSQIGWFLPLAFFGIIAGWFAFKKKGQRWYQLSKQQEELALWTGWLLPVYGFFSVASFFHPYYTIMLAPAIAALTGIGLAAVIKLRRAGGQQARLGTIFLAIALVTTSCLQAYYAWSYYPVISCLIILLGLIAALLWLFASRVTTIIKVSLSLLAITLLAGWWALTPTIAHNSAAIPAAGPSLLSGRQQDLGGQVDQTLLRYTKAHKGSAKYLFATTDANSASGYIIQSGQAVMALGGYNGTDKTMTLKQFKALVASGQLKYFVMGNQGKASSGQIGQIISWVKQHGRQVSLTGQQQKTTQSQMPGQSNSNTLYDLSNLT
ncbi:glycosyltransferase family 39 protein [Leuconostocaceae bacterium ESL0958]|nr:glycosyltransferase family 39 protein [Leuconostocaceae bacterium ESL0958]